MEMADLAEENIGLIIGVPNTFPASKLYELGLDSQLQYWFRYQFYFLHILLSHNKNVHVLERE